MRSEEEEGVKRHINYQASLHTEILLTECFGH